MKTLFLAAGALFAVAAPAIAQDASDPTMAPPATTSGYTGDTMSFTGPRAEIFGGWDRVGTRTRVTTAAGRDTDKSHKDGGTAGALLGYDIPLGDRLVVGAFGSYALSTTRTCADTGGCLKAGREIEGGARIGAKVMNDRALAYVKGAYVNGRIRNTTLDVADNADGWRAGAGVEYALNKHAYVKAEYDYTRFDSAKFDLGATPVSQRFDRNQVLAGFGVRF